MKKNNLITNKGVTFMELIVAVSVLSIALLALYAVMTYGIRINRQSKSLAVSYEIANKEIETVRNTPFANLTNQTAGSFYSDSATDLARLSGGYGTLTIRDYGGSDKIKEIIVNVIWTDTDQTKTTTVTTLAAEGGLNQ